MKQPEILFDLHSGEKSESNPKILKDDFRRLQSRYTNYRQVYADVVKRGFKGWYSNMQRIPDDSSISTAIAKTIDIALDFIRTGDTNTKFVLFSDSLSVLKAMNNTSSKNPPIQKLFRKNVTSF